MVKQAFALLALQFVIVACSSPPPEPASEYNVSTLVDPRGEPIRFKRPEGLAVDLNGNLYVVEALGGIWRVSPEGIASNLVAGEALSLPAKIALGDDGALYITESAANRAIKVGPDGTLSIVAGIVEVGYQDGGAMQAQFSLPLGIAVDGDGNLYVADSGNSRIRKITAEGQVSTLAGNERGFADGRGEAASFNGISGLTIDESGTLYVAEADGERVRSVSADGLVSTVAGNGEIGYGNGPALTALFHGPTDVALDAAGNIYVADLGNHSVRQITTDGQVVTLAGNGEQGNVDGPGPEARFKFPQAVAVDSDGVIYVADSGNGVIRILKRISTQ